MMPTLTVCGHADVVPTITDQSIQDWYVFGKPMPRDARISYRMHRGGIVRKVLWVVCIESKQFECDRTGELNGQGVWAIGYKYNPPEPEKVEKLSKKKK